MNWKLLFSVALALVAPIDTVEAADFDAKVPNFIGESEPSNRSAGSPLRTLRFLTTLDFPPFSYLDSSGRITGFNVYLAKAICAELKIQSACTIQALPFHELGPAMVAGRGDAIISGIAADEISRAEFSFSSSYMRFPGRFVASKSRKSTLDFDGGLLGVKIGVVAGSGHEKLVRSYFPLSTVIGITSEQLLVSELRADKIDVLFGDGLNFSFWIHGEASKNCCELVGGAYYSALFLGEGMRIAALNSRPDVIEAVNQSLSSIQQKQGFEELFLRFFPNSFF